MEHDGEAVAVPLTGPGRPGSLPGPALAGIPRGPAAEPGKITKRQVEVLCLLAKGLTSREVAEVLTVSEHTIVRHVANMMAATGAANRLELVARAIIGGLLENASWPPRPTGRLRVAAICGDPVTSVSRSPADHAEAAARG